MIVGHCMLHIGIGGVATCTHRPVCRAIVYSIAGPSPIAIVIVAAMIAIPTVISAAISITSTIEACIERTIETTAPAKTISKP